MSIARNGNGRDSFRATLRRALEEAKADMGLASRTPLKDWNGLKSDAPAEALTFESLLRETGS